MSGTSIGLAMMWRTRVVARSCTGRATACLTWTVPATTSSASRTGNRLCPVWRASSITALARSVASSVCVRTRGVMISPAVRAPNSTDFSISSAVSTSRVPWSAEREIRLASSVDERAERSSSWGSMPRRRTTALAAPLSTLIGQALAKVKARWNPCVARAVSIGRAMARFLGTSSPKMIVRNVLRTRPVASAVGRTPDSGTPAASRGPAISVAIAGSARKPIARLVTVMPTCAPESWVDSDRSAFWTPAACASPASAARSTAPRSTVTNANSAATNTPQARISSRLARRSRVAVTAQTLYGHEGSPRESAFSL